MSLFNYVKSQLSILSVVGEYATLKKAGIYWKGQCPFHSEKTPSFTVSPHKEIFYCFGCHVGGDVISFMAKVEHCTPLEAARQLVDRYQLKVPEAVAYELKAESGKAHYFDVCQFVAKWCHQQLMQSQTALSYIAKRGIDKQRVTSFGIGYFPGGLSVIKKFLDDAGKQQLLAEDFVDIKLLSRGKNVLFSPFEERIIFPIADHLGRVCGFGGRVFKEGDSRPKYYNSHENEFFAKGQLLFGLDLAKKQIQTTQKVLMVEGYTDCVAVAQVGFSNVVATLGTACTQDHLKLLSRYAQELYLLYDGDKAGMQAMLRIAQMCWDVSIELYVVPLPSAEDPASFIERGGDLKALLEQAQDIFSYFIQRMGDDFSSKSLADKVAATRKVIEMLAHIQDSLKQDFLMQQASQVLGLPLQTLKREVRQVNRAQQSSPSFAQQASPEADLQGDESEDGQLGSLEKKIFYSILHNPGLFVSKIDDFITTCLPKPLNEICALLKNEKHTNPALTFNDFFQTLDGQYQRVVSKIVLEHQEEIGMGEFEQLMTQFQKKHWKVMVNDIKLKLESAKVRGDEQEVTRLVHEFIELKKRVLKIS